MLHKGRNIAELEAFLERRGFQPLSTRSLLLSFLLGTHPPEASVERLVAFGDRFGVRGGTVRTTLSRMVAAGDVTTERARYRLAPRLLERQRRQDEGQLSVVRPGSWDGAWWTAVVVGSERSMTARRHFRASMTDARMGELRPDIWMRPANLAEPPHAQDIIVAVGPLITGHDEALARELWDVGALEREARELADGLDALDDMIDDDPGHLPLAFDVSTVCVRFLRTEPQLPLELVAMPACRELRAGYREFNERFVRALERWLDDR